MVRQPTSNAQTRETIDMKRVLLTTALALWTGATGWTGAVSAAQLNWAFQADAETMDPHGRFEIFNLGFLHAIYEPLVRYDQDLSIEPALATDWEVVDDLTWRFDLRQGVTFHDGSAFTAEDVVFSFERSKKEGSAFIPTFGPVDSVVALDDYTVEFRLNTPQPVLLNSLAFWFIMDSGWAAANDAVDPVNLRAGVTNGATLAANGTGPFRLMSRSPGVETVLAAHAAWWDTPGHNLTDVTFTPIGSDATRVAALISGEVDLIDPVPLQDVARLEAAEELAVLQGPELRVIFLGLDQHRDVLLGGDPADGNPFRDVRVRQAVAHAIDVDAIIDRVMRGAAAPAGLLIAPGVSGYAADLDDRPAYDPDRARALLAEAGFPDGFAVEMDCPNDRYINDEAICQAAVSMLAQVGIEVDLIAQSRSVYFNKILGGDTSFYLLGWTPGNMDVIDVLKPVMHTRGQGFGFFNIGRYSNARVDTLTQAIETETVAAARTAMIAEALTLHRDEVGHIPLHVQYLSWGLRDNVSIPQRRDGVQAIWLARVEE